MAATNDTGKKPIATTNDAGKEPFATTLINGIYPSSLPVDRKCSVKNCAYPNIIPRYCPIFPEGCDKCYIHTCVFCKETPNGLTFEIGYKIKIYNVDELKIITDIHQKHKKYCRTQAFICNACYDDRKETIPTGRSCEVRQYTSAEETAILARIKE